MCQDRQAPLWCYGVMKMSRSQLLNHKKAAILKAEESSQAQHCLAPWSWSSSLQNFRKTHLLSQRVCGLLLLQPELIQPLLKTSSQGSLFHCICLYTNMGNVWVPVACVCVCVHACWNMKWELSICSLAQHSTAIWDALRTQEPIRMKFLILKTLLWFWQRMY